GAISRESQIEHWKQRGICPRDVHARMDDAEIRQRCYRQMAPKVLGVRKQDVESMSDEQVHRAVLEHWYVTHCWGKESKAKGMSDDALRSALDESKSCLAHDLRFVESVEDLGGLHVISSERHESRRVDNQLRGRSGRQGDKGSSRFFLSLEDDLMKMFAGPTTLKILSKLGMKEGDAIEHPMLSRSVGKAQRKVEERNFLIRKNILEYDEVMDHQRHDFYGMRQLILEGKGIKDRIFEHLNLAIEDACWRFIHEPFAANCMTEWVQEHLGVHIDAERLLGKDREDLHELIRTEGKDEAGRVIEVTLGEFLSEDIDLGKGGIVERDQHGDDYQGLSNWAASHFKAELSPAALRALDRDGVEVALQNAADALIDSADLSGLDPFLIEHYAQHELSRWVASKFGIEQAEDVYEELTDPEAASERICAQSQELYAERERRYPIEFALDMTTAAMQHNPQEALGRFCVWARQRYDLDWKPDALPSTNPLVLRDILLAESVKWDDDRIMQRVDHVIASGGSDAESMNTWCMANLGTRMTPEDQSNFEEDPRGVIEQLVRNTLRMEMLQFERWILLQIVDTAWKDHLHGMDQLRESIGYRSFSQRDPRIEFKREGANLYEEMQMEIRDRVTDLIFKAKLQPQIQQRGRPGEEAKAAPRPAPAPAAQTTRAATAGATAPPAAQGQAASAQQPRQKSPANAAMTLGRNEVVTVLDPKSGKKETMKFKKAKPLLEQGWRLVNE
ncbi:MAG: hypothetical protein MK095_01575, partial [Phycisphaerales bacterium]|nr:hypothetical protein [Phycisphaerales bacterium]